MTAGERSDQAKAGSQGTGQLLRAARGQGGVRHAHQGYHRCVAQGERGLIAVFTRGPIAVPE
eukprot:43509-Eustigmatos_ZCMA.PRE.1